MKTEGKNTYIEDSIGPINDPICLTCMQMMSRKKKENEAE